VPTEDELKAQLDSLNAELDDRSRRHAKVEPYFEAIEGRSPVPAAVTQARMTNAYRHLMSMSETPWGKVIVNSKLDRLEVTGIRSEDEGTDEAVWGVWQDEAMDLESKLAHSSALLDGRAHALVWPRDGQPRISLDDVTQMVVQYEEGSRRHRVAALRRWAEGDRVLCTLYRPDGIFKFQRDRSVADWERREPVGEAWPLRNPLGVVPVVELAVNRRLKPGGFAHARGEFEDVTGLMDRINLLTFLGLVVAVWMGFPLRGVIGDKIMRDDDGNALPPFESRPDSVVQFENPDAKLVDFKAAGRENLSIFDELTQLAAATSTPRHYLPMGGGISNVSEPTIRAFEGGMHATVNGSHKPSLGEGWEEVLRLSGRMLDEPVELSQRAAIQWADHESRSLGERADAALKLSQAGLPWQGVADLALNLGQDQIARYAAEQAGSAFGDLLTAAQAPVGGNGAVPVG
jgi:hypothetical protein